PAPDAETGVVLRCRPLAPRVASDSRSESATIPSPRHDLERPMNPAHPPPGCCTPDEHRLHRRLFLKGLAASGATAVTSFSGLFTNPAFADAARKAEKKVILLWLCGAPSQFETWDPKPGRPSGGPFGTTPTSVPGVHFSSLMPRCAS